MHIHQLAALRYHSWCMVPPHTSIEHCCNVNEPLTTYTHTHYIYQHPYIFLVFGPRDIYWAGCMYCMQCCTTICIEQYNNKMTSATSVPKCLFSPISWNFDREFNYFLIKWLALSWICESDNYSIFSALIRRISALSEKQPHWKVAKKVSLSRLITQYKQHCNLK